MASESVVAYHIDFIRYDSCAAYSFLYIWEACSGCSEIARWKNEKEIAWGGADVKKEVPGALLSSKTSHAAFLKNGEDLKTSWDTKKQNWKDGLRTLSRSYRARLEFTSRDKWSMRRDKQPVSVVLAARPWWTGWRSECDWPIERKTRYQQVTLTSLLLYFVFMICFSGFRRATLDKCDFWKAEDGK